MRARSSSRRPWRGETSCGGSPAVRGGTKDSIEGRVGGEEALREIGVDRLGVRSQLRRPRPQRRLEPPQSRLHRLGLLRLQPALQRRGRRGRHRLAVLASSSSRRETPSDARQPSSSASAASSASESWSAASRPRPWSRSSRARSANSSQASATSRPDRTAASRCCGRQQHRALLLRRRQLGRLLPVAVRDLLARAVADPRRQRLRLAHLGDVRVARRQPVAVDRAVEQHERFADGLVPRLDRLASATRARRPRAADRSRSPSRASPRPRPGPPPARRHAVAAAPAAGAGAARARRSRRRGAGRPPRSGG